MVSNKFAQKIDQHSICVVATLLALIQQIMSRSHFDQNIFNPKIAILCTFKDN